MKGYYSDYLELELPDSNITEDDVDFLVDISCHLWMRKKCTFLSHDNEKEMYAKLRPNRLKLQIMFYPEIFEVKLDELVKIVDKINTETSVEDEYRILNELCHNGIRCIVPQKEYEVFW